MTRDWSPSIYDHTIRTRGAIPEVGQLIGCSDRRAYHVIEVIERSRANWHDATTRKWEEAGSPDPATWPDRERKVVLRPVRALHPSGRTRITLTLYPWTRDEQWWALPDPYPACVECQMLWPCPCDDRNQAAAAAMAELERLGGVLPGCCWACSEPITSRHHSIEFPGENLLMPGAPAPAFHTSHSRKAARGPSGNQTCRGDAEQYEQQWVAADPTRKVRLTCPGIMFRHFGYSECTTSADCPGENASHANFVHCTTAHYTNWSVDGGAVQAIPLTSCDGRGCRGPKVPASNLTPATDQPA